MANIGKHCKFDCEEKSRASGVRRAFLPKFVFSEFKAFPCPLFSPCSK